MVFNRCGSVWAGAHKYKAADSIMAIGVFDSGVGGLTVYKELAAAFPESDLIYLGDTARVPYGNKSPQTITRYATDCARYLVDNYQVKSLIVACNTISSYALEPLEAEFGLPVLGVIQAGATAALAVTKNRQIGVVGTRATINSNAYANMLRSLTKESIDVRQLACPLFVPLVEEGLLTGDIPELTVKMYMDGLVATGVDTIILGCTHYPLLTETIHKIYPAIQLVDSAKMMVAQMTRLQLAQAEAHRREILVTDASSALEELKSRLVGDILMKLVNIGQE
jgi:glutamate racemase